MGYALDTFSSNFARYSLWSVCRNNGRRRSPFERLSRTITGLHELLFARRSSRSSKASQVSKHSHRSLHRPARHLPQDPTPEMTPYRTNQYQSPPKPSLFSRLLDWMCGDFCSCPDCLNDCLDGKRPKLFSRHRNYGRCITCTPNHKNGVCR